MKGTMLAGVVLVTCLFSVQAQSELQAPPIEPTSGGGAAVSVLGKYIIRGGTDFIEIQGDGAFSGVLGGKARRGTYKIESDTITLRLKNELKKTQFYIRPDSIVGVERGSVWEKEGVPRVGSSSPLPIDNSRLGEPHGTDSAREPSNVQRTAGQTMKEVEEWVHRDLPPMGSDRIVVSDKKNRFETRYEIESAKLSTCALTIRFSSDIYSGPNNDPLVKRIDVVTATMKDVDVRKVLAREADVGKGYTASKPSFVIPLVARENTGEPFTINFGLSGVKKTKSVFVQVSDADMASEVANELRRAAVLCGAPDTQVVTAEVVPDKPKASAPTSKLDSIMTNADVVELVAAGLSDEVVAKAVRAAKLREFDLTPPGLIALKKAKVPDVVISAMQDAAAVGTAPSGGVEKAPSKYDPSLAEAPKSVAAPAVQSPCAGVELMGLFKEDMRPVSPLIIYLAKIRNSTNVTRIVTLQWMNMYTEEFRSTAEIGAGQIATLQLAAQEPFQRQPTQLRITNCR